jgi:hypothetical protein
MSQGAVISDADRIALLAAERALTRLEIVLRNCGLSDLALECGLKCTASIREALDRRRPTLGLARRAHGAPVIAVAAEARTHGG